MPWSFKLSFSFGLSHQNPVHVSPLSHACNMPNPPHSPWFDLRNDIWLWVQSYETRKYCLANMQRRRLSNQVVTAVTTAN
jgi:hypothetical protein